MFIYILRRILLMIPTFIAVSLIVFLIINMAPGTPGELASAQGQESADESGSKREAYRIFKKQFNLDKPILLNFRYGLSQNEIFGYLAQIAYVTKASSKEIIAGQETLENYGQYAVPHLVAIIQQTKNATDVNNQQICWIAVKKFSENARSSQFDKYRDIRGIQAKRLWEQFDKQNPKLREEKGEGVYQSQLLSFINQQIGTEYAYVQRLWYPRNAPPQKKREVIGKIEKWYQEKSQNARYQYSFFDKMWITLFDTRFARYWWNLLHFDFGISHTTRLPVLETVMSKMRYSISLSFTSLLIVYVIAVPLGIFSAVKQNILSDRVTTVLLFMLYSLPSFFIGTLLLQLFSKGGDYWPWFPTGGFQALDYKQLTTWAQLKDIIWHITLPLICLSYVGLASLSRYARSGLLDVIRSDYIKTARAKGLPEYLVILRHAVRNGMIPVLTLLASLLPVLLGGSVVIEYIFAIDGMGFLNLMAITARDYNTIMCITLLSALLVMVGVLLSDISYALVDPRISFK